MKNCINIEISIPKDTCHLRIIGRVCEKIAQEISCSDELHKTLSSNLALVVTEGLVNAIKHAKNGGDKSEINLKINVTDRTLLIKIFDKGTGFDLDSIPLPDFGITCMEEKGRGIFILRSLMDEVEYIKENGWNVLKMTKKLI